MALPVHLRLVSLSRCHSRAIGVLFCRAFLFVRPRLLGGPKIVPGRDDRRRLRLGVGIESRRLPVHVWRCRRPSPYGGLDPLRRETSTATVAIHASGGRCSTRPCAHAIGPSSFSAVRRQVWLKWPMTRIILPRPRGENSSPAAPTAAPVPLASTPSVGRAIGKIRWVGWVVLLFLLICIRLIPPCDWQAPVGWLYCWSFSFVFI